MAPLRKNGARLSRPQCFLMINLVSIDQLCSYFTYVSLMTQGRPDCYSFWGQKAKWTRSQVRVVYISPDICFQMITSGCIIHHWEKIPIDFRSKGRWLMLQVRVVCIH